MRALLAYYAAWTKALVTADTAFRIASMSKSFTAISILPPRDEAKSVTYKVDGL